MISIIRITIDLPIQYRRRIGTIGRRKAVIGSSGRCFPHMGRNVLAGRITQVHTSYHHSLILFTAVPCPHTHLLVKMLSPLLSDQGKEFHTCGEKKIMKKVFCDDQRWGNGQCYWTRADLLAEFALFSSVQGMTIITEDHHYHKQLRLRVCS